MFMVGQVPRDQQEALALQAQQDQRVIKVARDRLVQPDTLGIWVHLESLVIQAWPEVPVHQDLMARMARKDDAVVWVKLAHPEQLELVAPGPRELVVQWDRQVSQELADILD